MAKSKRLIEILILLLVIHVPLVISIYIHDPNTELPAKNFGLKYTDIVYGLSYPIFENDERWFNAETFQKFKSSIYKYPIPYVDYKFEYPPLVGLLWYISTRIAFEYTSNLKDAIRVNYYVQSIFTIILYIFLVCSLSVLLKTKKQNPHIEFYKLLVFLLPSTLIYVIYNWDVATAAFAVIGILCILREKYFLTGVLLGLSFSTKILTIGVVFYYMVKLLIVEEKRVLGLKYLVGFIISGVIPFILLYVISPRGFSELLNHHMSWYCENCLYLPLIRDIYSNLHKILFYTITILIACGFLLFGYPWRNISVRDEYKYLFVGVVSLVLFNYVFSPQMFLLITPLAILALGVKALLLYSIADIFNALIIYTFFNYPNSWMFGSVTQYMALGRNLILLVLFIYITMSIIRSRLKMTRTSRRI